MDAKAGGTKSSPAAPSKPLDIVMRLKRKTCQRQLDAHSRLPSFRGQIPTSNREFWSQLQFCPARRGKTLRASATLFHFHKKIPRHRETTRIYQRLPSMENKQEFHDELERYRALLAETTDPVGLLLLKDIVEEMEEIERKWDELKHRP
jgi:hypothetical protein